MSLAKLNSRVPAEEEVVASRTGSGRLARFFKENALSLTVVALFAIFLIGQALAGWLEFNEAARQHHESVVRFLPYLLTAHFWEAVFENWESEFLQMAAYVWLTSFLVQKGSAESKKLPDEGENAQDQLPPDAGLDPRAPWPVRKGGWCLKVYERSLSLTLGVFFLLSFAGHAVAGAREYSQDLMAHGQHSVSTMQFLWTSRFWFESLQNWQSEFLAVLSLVCLSIWLRDKGSPESKPVAAPHAQTGSS